MESNKSEEDQTIPKVLFIEQPQVFELFDKLIPNMHAQINKRGLQMYTDDIIQECYITYWLKSKEESIQSPEAYFFKIFFLKLHEFCRKKSKSSTTSLEIENDSLVCDKLITQNQYIIDEVNFQNQEKLKKIEEIIDLHLNPNQQEIIRMKYFDGLSSREIGEILNKSEDAVNHAAKRGRDKLKNLLS